MQEVYCEGEEMLDACKSSLTWCTKPPDEICLQRQTLWVDYMSSTNVLLTLKYNNETDAPLNTKCSVVNINKAHTVKMSATLLLLLNSLWQMLDTAYVNRLLLKMALFAWQSPMVSGWRAEGEGGIWVCRKEEAGQTGIVGQMHWDRQLSPSQEIRLHCRVYRTLWLRY